MKPLLRLAVSLNNHVMSQLYFAIFGVTIIYQCNARNIISAFRLTNCCTGGKNDLSINLSNRYSHFFDHRGRENTEHRVKQIKDLLTIRNNKTCGRTWQ